MGGSLKLFILRWIKSNNIFIFVDIYAINFEMLNLTPYTMENMKIDLMCILKILFKI